MIALALVCALVVALLSGTLVLFQSKAMWSMDSPNARAWNATFNTTATMGLNIIPVVLLIICVAFVCMCLAGARGF